MRTRFIEKENGLLHHVVADDAENREHEGTIATLRSLRASGRIFNEPLGQPTRIMYGGE